MSRPVTAIGCRVKSGGAVATLVAGPQAAPLVVDRRRITLADPRTPATAQPYHATFGTEQTDAAVIRRLRQIVARCATQSLRGLLRHYKALGHRPRGMALVVGSTVDPATIANQHVRAHALEGQLFRTVLEHAAARQGLRCAVVRERDLNGLAARALGLTEPRLRLLVERMGQEVGRPWRAEDKAAALAGWLMLLSRGPRTAPAAGVGRPFGRT